MVLPGDDASPARHHHNGAQTGDAVLQMLRKQGFLSDGSELEAMKAYAAAKQLPSRKTRIGCRAERLGGRRSRPFFAVFFFFSYRLSHEEEIM